MREKQTVIIEWNGEELEVTGSYYPGFHGTYEQPPERPEFDIEEIHWIEKKNISGVKIWHKLNVADLLCADENVMFAIEELCLAKGNDRIENEDE